MSGNALTVLDDIQELRGAIKLAKAEGKRIGCVPTMGALHDGHLSLIEAAKRDGCFVVVTVFVNPTQFGEGEDYERYPRDRDGDAEKSRAAGVDLIFSPEMGEMYPSLSATTVHVATLTEKLCGPYRPGHFDGVATVVAKLFNIVRPDVAYFGEKDFQQLQVIRRMTRDLNMPVEIVGCPIVREDDGIAMSSRNAYLSASHRKQATSLYQSLLWAKAAIEGGETDSKTITSEMRRQIEAAGPVTIDYISIVDPVMLQPEVEIEGQVLVALAVKIGSTRLIDNVLVDVKHKSA